MHRMLFTTILGLSLLGCGTDSTSVPDSTTTTAAASAPAPAPAAPPSAPPAAVATATELINRRILFATAKQSNAHISPDGKYVSWMAPLYDSSNLWIAPTQMPSRVRPLTNAGGNRIVDYDWPYLPDTLLYLFNPGNDEASIHLYALDMRSGLSRDLTPGATIQAKIVNLSAQHPETVIVGINERDPRWHDLYQIDLRSGERQLLHRNDEQIAHFFLDQHNKLRYVIRSNDDGSGELLATTDTGWTSIQQIAFEDVLTTRVIGLSKDAKTLYLTDSHKRNTAALYALDTTSGQRTLLHEDARADIGEVLREPGNGRPQAVAVNYLRTQWHVLDPDIDADLQRLQALGNGDVAVHERTPDDRNWLISYSAPEAPLTYYLYRRDNAATPLIRLFSAHPELEDKPLVAMWPQTIRARDGIELPSYLSLPAHADSNHDGRPEQPLPLVLLVHDGPWSRDRYDYDARTQWLANRGYAVLSVNYRGSTGFGKTFTAAGNGQWAGKMQEDLLDAAQWAVEHKITTDDQIAIMGNGYGGYAALVGLSFTPERFRCGIDFAGPADLHTLLAATAKSPEAAYRAITRRIADPETAEGAQWLQANSPLARADQISKPLLIGQRAYDTQVTRAESEQIVSTMQARKTPVSYVLFPSHELYDFQRADNQLAFNAVSEAFLSKCLGGRAESFGVDTPPSVPFGAEHIPGLSEALRQ